jgi:uncharacterized membrane protein YoaK (UPF0700 family)
MLRPRKFRRFELRIVRAIALLLVTVAVIGAVLAAYRGNWRLLIASAGMGGLAAIYVYAARRGQPL